MASADSACGCDITVIRDDDGLIDARGGKLLDCGNRSALKEIRILLISSTTMIIVTIQQIAHALWMYVGGRCALCKWRDDARRVDVSGPPFLFTWDDHMSNGFRTTTNQIITL